MATTPWGETHPFLNFDLDLAALSRATWAVLGECSSKIDHISGVPLKPETSAELLQIFLAKGVHGTTAIEGNTLSEAQVLEHLEGRLELPASQAYLAAEIDNIVKAYNQSIEDARAFERPQLSRERLRMWNRQVLTGLALDEGVEPGEFRRGVVRVNEYVSPTSDHTDELVRRLVDWMASPEWRPRDNMPRFVLPILQAIVAHLYIAWIHPFGDGNGRTARLVEFELLTCAGVPIVSSHLLADHYNTTRTAYYRALTAARARALSFVEYAVQGLADGLREQLSFIGKQQFTVAWVNYVHEVMHAEADSRTTKRRKLLALALGTEEKGLPMAGIGTLSADLGSAYFNKPRLLARDLNFLERVELVRTKGRHVYPRLDRLRSFLPFRRSEAPSSESTK